MTMPRHIVIKNGDDALTAPIVAYLRSQYGMDPADIKSVALVSEVGQPQLLTVTMMTVGTGITVRDVDPLGRGNAAQREGVWLCGDPYPPALGSLPYVCSMGAGHADSHRAGYAGETLAIWPNKQRSDLHKCDESTLRSPIHKYDGEEW
jgi:hypothetical protein